MALVENTTQILSLFPEELVSRITWVIQAIGGLFVIYITLMIVRIYLLTKEIKLIRQMKKDIEFIKRKLRTKK